MSNTLFHRYYKTHIHGADEGPLSGKLLAVKDNIAVAGVPMMNGSSLLEGYVPEFDATVVTKILDAGSFTSANCIILYIYIYECRFYY